MAFDIPATGHWVEREIPQSENWSSEMVRKYKTNQPQADYIAIFHSKQN